ncbi:MAG TPA: prolipoprotein diacylglyceryl transferase [Candidatus Acidoferrum sp.]|jgi:phosphatidylglycerol:prolipoprotein diacylglycerol transferase
MIPYLHLGPLTIPTFGLMVALALITSAYILQADFDRRGFKADAFTMITIAGLAGIAGAKLYHLLESPTEFFANPIGLIFTRYGFAWFGGFLGGFGTMVYLGLREKLPLREFLDACSPAACSGYAIGRIGCLLSGDGDYGKPTSLPWGMSFPNGVVPTTDHVHPTPLYECFVWCILGAILWKFGSKVTAGKKTNGEIFALYLILTGIARFLVEIIRINPPWLLGMSNAQVASVFSFLIGIFLLFRWRTPART